MKLLLITNLRHKASKKLIKFLKLKRINFDYVDTSLKKKIKITKNYDFLISFLNPAYINKSIRNKIKKNSYNFHPGPPEYPGFGCYNFALLNKTKFYGSTIHVIDDKLDSGEIVNVKKFKISYKNISLEKLISKTHKNLLNQGRKFILDLINKNIEFKTKFRWSKKAYTKKQFEKARQIKINDSKSEILNKIKAFSYKNYDCVYIKLGGFKLEIKC